MGLLPWWLDFSDEEKPRKQKCVKQSNNDVAMLALAASIAALIVALKEKDKKGDD